MGVLLLLLGLLAAASGGFKLRPRVRALLGYSSLAVAEVVLGALTIIGSGIGLARARPLAWAVVVGVFGLILWSAAAHVRALMLHQKKHEALEGARLRSFLRS